MVARPPIVRRGTAPAPTAAAILMALLLAACGSQIPFGTPRPELATPPTGTPSAAVSGAPTAPPSAARSAGATDAPTAAPASEVPLPTPPTTAVTYNVADTTGLQITLPPGWVGYDGNSAQAAVLAAAREHPELAETLDRLGNGQLAFVALDASATGQGQAPSMTISAIGGAIPVASLLEALAQNTIAEIKRSQPVDGDVELTPIELPPGPAVNLRWRLEATEDQEPLGLDAYILSVGASTYLVTFAVPVSVLEGFQPAFEGIVGSMTAA